jgi:hypothetical protein
MVGIKKMRPILPFFFLGLMHLISGAISYFKIDNSLMWLPIELLSAVFILWIFILILNKNKDA